LTVNVLWFCEIEPLAFMVTLPLTVSVPLLLSVKVEEVVPPTTSELTVTVVPSVG
jgi:hypothetical protein